MDFNNDEFDLRGILRNCSQSNRLLRKYEDKKENNRIVHRKLSEGESKIICHAIVFWLLDKGIILSTGKTDYIDIFEKIQIIFQKETMSSYYIPPTSFSMFDKKTKKTIKKQVTARGKLYQIFKYNLDKARNERKKEKGDLTPYYRRSKKNILKQKDSIEVELHSKEEELEMKKWLSLHHEPWPTIVSKWKMTRSLRALDLKNDEKSTEDVVFEWPRYSKRYGYELIDIDFQHLFPGKDNLKEYWPVFRQAIIDLGIAEATDRKKANMACKLEAYKCVEESQDRDKNMEGILALHSIFFLAPNKNSTTKQFLESILIQAEHGETIKDLVEKLSKEAATSNTFSPTIIYYVNDENIPHKFYVCVNDLMYETETAVTAIDILFKIFYVFDLAYPDKCTNLLTFIQHFFYNIYYECDFRSSKLMNLMIQIDETIGTAFEKRVLNKVFDARLKGNYFYLNEEIAALNNFCIFRI